MLKPTITQYPAKDPGIPVQNCEDLLGPLEPFIDRIKFQLSDSQFSKYIKPVLDRYAKFVHLLPASRTEHFKGAGGLLAIGIQMGFYTLQSADGLIFTAQERMEDRKRFEDYWRIAAFYVGLCAEIAPALSCMNVCTEDGDSWPSYLISLHEWLSQKSASTYFVKWNQGRHHHHQSISTFYNISKIIPDEIVQEIHSLSPRIVTSMMDAISGITEIGHSNRLTQAVRKLRIKLIDRDIRSNAAHYGSVMVGSHLEPYLIGAMRELVASGKWKCNKPKSRLWYSSEGLFVVMPLGMTEIQQTLADEDIPGIPVNVDALLDILVKAKVFELNAGSYWSICTPGKSNPLQVVRLCEPDLIVPFDSADTWEPLSESLLIGQQVVATEGAQTKKLRAEKKSEKKSPGNKAKSSTPKPNAQKQEHEESCNASHPPPAFIDPPLEAYSDELGEEVAPPSSELMPLSEEVESSPPDVQLPAEPELPPPLKRRHIEFLASQRDALKKSDPKNFLIEDGAVGIPVGAITRCGFDTETFLGELIASQALVMNGDRHRTRLLRLSSGEQLCFFVKSSCIPA